MRGLKIFGILFVAVLALVSVVALPTGPGNVSEGPSSRYGVSGARNLSAIAGNVTEVSFDATAVTQNWQGYFGNITGTIVLGNSNNQSLYNWNLANPQGEIYATRYSGTPVWASVGCANSTHIDDEDTALNANQTRDADSVNNTFSTKDHVAFLVGSVPIAVDNCSSIYLNNNTGAQTTYFSEVLLSDGTNPIIYTALIEDSIIGFDGLAHDFQMIVGEDGHLGDNDATPYYFYLEIE